MPQPARAIVAEPLLSIILPAHNEAAYIGACLGALLESDADGFSVEVIVVANACTDDTANVAERYRSEAQKRGWGYEVVSTEPPGKLAALNRGESQTQGEFRAYLDADVIVSPDLLGQIVDALDTDGIRFASGTPIISRARSGVTRAFARFWQELPFVADGVPGFGLFAVNTAGRARWGDFPDDIISDDTFVRLHFAPDERIRVPATYSWPMVEGLRNLVRVRRRQDAGVAEIAERFPDLMDNDETSTPAIGALARMALRDPVGFGTYALVKLLVKTPYASSAERWARGR